MRYFACSDHVSSGAFCFGLKDYFDIFEKRHFNPDLGGYLIFAIFYVLKIYPEIGNHGKLCSRPKYKGHKIQKHHHPTVLPFDEIPSWNICFAKSMSRNRNRMILLGLWSTISKCKLLLSSSHRLIDSGLLELSRRLNTDKPQHG